MPKKTTIRFSKRLRALAAKINDDKQCGSFEDLVPVLKELIKIVAQLFKVLTWGS